MVAAKIAASMTWTQMHALREAHRLPSQSKIRFAGSLKRAAYGMARRRKPLVHEGYGGFIGDCHHSYWTTDLGGEVYCHLMVARPDLFPAFSPLDEQRSREIAA